MGDRRAVPQAEGGWAIPSCPIGKLRSVSKWFKGFNLKLTTIAQMTSICHMTIGKRQTVNMEG